MLQVAAILLLVLLQLKKAFVFFNILRLQAVYIAPLKALVRERIDDWKVRFEQKLRKRFVSKPYLISLTSPRRSVGRALG